MGIAGLLSERARQRLKRLPCVEYFYRRVKWYCHLQYSRSPWSVALETTAPCNRTCSYCPVSLHKRAGEMSRELFEKIIADLATIGFNRTLSFHFYNEPLLDDRLPELVAHARSMLPGAVFDVFTNGDRLTPSLIAKLLDSGLDVIRVSLHSPNSRKFIDRILAQVGAGHRSCVDLTSYYDRPQKGEFLFNRIDMSATSHGRLPPVYGTGCSMVNSLMINYEGRTALCCNDFHSANGHGSLVDHSVGDLWCKSRALRKRIYLGAYELQICQICNAPV